MAIKFVTKKEVKKRKKVKPHYLLVYNYMIGDADGNTTEEVTVSLDNPYVEKYCKLLNKLNPTKGYWGVSLDQDRLKDHLKAKQITKNDFEFLSKLMFENYEEDDTDDDFAYEFYDGVRSETEYSFLTFEGVDLYYVNEYGQKLETKFTK